MFSPFHFKALQVFSVKSPSSTSSLSSTKLKSLINTLILSHMCRIIRALSKVKTIILEILGDSRTLENKKKKIILGSFRLHYNWCSSKSSSHVLPVPAPVYDGLPSNRFYSEDSHESDSEQLAGYLQWLEDKVQDNGNDGHEINENIDVLAEMFIANCHEKFRLEKQESDRRFQEMLARSM